MVNFNTLSFIATLTDITAIHSPHLPRLGVGISAGVRPEECLPQPSDKVFSISTPFGFSHVSIPSAVLRFHNITISIHVNNYFFEKLSPMVWCAAVIPLS